MSDRAGLLKRLIASVRALLPEDWRGRAGARFHKAVDTISTFAEEHQVRPADLAHGGVELARTALQGAANEKLAAAVLDYAEAEDKKIETELKRRSLESEVRKKEAEARKAEIETLSAELELERKLREFGIALRCDERGNLTILPAPAGFDFSELQNRLLREGDKNAGG